MPKFVIERELPGAGKLSPAELRGLSQKSYVTNDKTCCVYIAPDEASIRRRAEEGGFPANRISRVHRVIDPTTGD